MNTNVNVAGNGNQTIVGGKNHSQTNVHNGDKPQNDSIINNFEKTTSNESKKYQTREEIGVIAEKKIDWAQIGVIVAIIGVIVAIIVGRDAIYSFLGI